MRAFVLQDWLTVRGAGTVTTIVQNEANYLSLDAYQDVVFWLQVAEYTSSANSLIVNYETAPLKDETLFAVMTSATLSTPIMTPPLITKVLASAASTPLARWVRWHVTSTNGSAWDMTFRILVAGNQLFSVGQGMGVGGLGAGMGGWPMRSG
ncbi:MAG TPA: hypothetical protein VK662_15035 [Acidothermaceae bacterium]|jgi:hypothetical protein|nr:hypothetical protein [Acidothermaceae bacterium]